MRVESRIERVTGHNSKVVAYLKRNLVRNALDVWNLETRSARYDLYVCKVSGGVEAHLGIYSGEDAKYVDIGGSERAVEKLLGLVPPKAVITAPPALGNIITHAVRPAKVYPNDIMIVERGQEKLSDSEGVKRLTGDDAVQYSEFGSSFNAPKVKLKRIREALQERIVFGAFSDRSLVSIASLVSWLPSVAVIMGVETKEEFRRRGFGSSVVSAAVREGLGRSRSCALFVRSDNYEAIRLYLKLGFRKHGDELWIDRGTGIVP